MLELSDLLPEDAVAKLGDERSTAAWSRRRVLGHAVLALGATLSPGLRVRAQGVGPVMAELAGYMAAAADRMLPAEVVEQAKHHILDTLAAMLSGAELPPGRAALRFAREQGARGSATVIGGNSLLGPLDAALVNGTLAHSDETDDSHGPSQSHPGAAVVPAALALGEDRGRDGAHFLRAVVLGYDVGTRLTMALGGGVFRDQTRRSTHAYAGTFGAAAAAGCAARLDERGMRWLLDYASQQAAGYAVWGRDGEHIEKAFVFGGMPARAGVTAATLVSAGWTGVDDVLSGEDNFLQVNAANADASMLVDGLGQRYEITRTDIKKWTVGSPIQAPLDALELLRQRHGFAAADVTELVVQLAPSVGAVVDARDIPDICLQHMLAVMLVDGTVSFNAAHDTSRMRDPAVLHERAKVRYVPEESLTALLPARVAIVEVALRDGARHSERVEAVRGTARNPMTRDEVVAKARDLMEPVLGSRKANRAIDTLLGLETLRELRALRPLLQR
ncbi:MAG TPA: MmgE/PrpD family protein [Gammaproteobacteria bacterium]|nr:MmgE/PrpD family protein [Gammaproteobacteria bacterium]